MKQEQITALLDKADEHFDKAEYPQAEKLANEVLTVPNARVTLSKDDEARAYNILGKCYSETARYDAALKHYDNASLAAEAALSLGLQSIAMSGTAWIQNMRGESKAALDAALPALALAIKTEDKKAQARALNTIGCVYLNLADYLRSLDSYVRLLAIAEDIGDKRYVATSLSNLGNVHSVLGNYPQALDYYGRSLAIHEEIGNKLNVASTLINIGSVQWRLADYAHALDNSARALAFAEEIGDKRLVRGSLGCLGCVHRSLGDYPRALNYFARALALGEEMGIKQSVSIYLGNIGCVHQDFADYPRALDYFSRSLVIAEEIGDKQHISVLLNNFGSANYESGDHTRALEYFKRAIDLSYQIGNSREVGAAMQGIASVERKLGNLDASYQFGQDALRHRREVLNSNELVSETLLELGRTLIEMGKTDDALAQMTQSLALAEEIGEKKTASEAHKEIANAYAKMGDIAKAYEHSQKHYAVKEDIFSEQSRQLIDSFNIRVAIANQERDTELQRLRAEKSEATIRLKERELANTASSLAAQTELLGDFRADLRKIVMRPDQYEPEDVIRQVKAKLKALPCEMIDFGKFEAQFATVHPEFRARLETKFPELTPQEVKICMLMHVNLQTAAIARLTCLSERSVEGHRLNIRKKLALTKEQNLADALRTLDGK